MREVSRQSMRRTLWIIGILSGIIIVGSILVALFAEQTSVPVSRCRNCGVTQYRRYYHVVFLGLDINLPAGIDASRGRDNCPHQIEPLR
ncbi:MAG: hypothetical protein AAB263_19455 [Planctomycetota bacterium]